MDLSPPPPPPSTPPLIHLHAPGNTSFPVIAIAVIGILATAFLLISYYIFVIKCCLNWHRVDIFSRFFSRVRDPNDDTLSTATTTVSPAGNAAVQKGLEEALIRVIPVIEFRKLTAGRKVYDRVTTSSNNEGQADESAASYECAICLSEFKEYEKLRVIPNCCHAFHIDCIDIWLQSSANCPLCRSGISPSSILYNNQQKIINHISEDEEEEDGDNDDDFVVIEISGNNLDEPRMVSKELVEEKKKVAGRKRWGNVYSMGDELIDMRKKDEEFDIIQPIRRSISMDLSSNREFFLEIEQCCRRSNSNNNNMQESEVSCSSSSSSKVRRSIFSFGYGRSSRCSVQPVHLDP